MTVTADQIIMNAEVYLGDWAHSVHAAKRSVDAKATFFFGDDDEIRPLTLHQTRVGQGKKTPGKRLRMVLLEVDDDEQPAPPADSEQPGHAYGDYARDLRLSSFFRTPDVWRVLGSDAEFRDWVTHQPSIISGSYNEYDDAGNGRNVACHVRRAGESGVAYKPDYACVPMTDREHQLQHTHGEDAARQLAVANGIRTAAQMTGPDWFDQQRVAVLTAWGWQCVKTLFGVDSMADLPPEQLFEWANGEGVAGYLPACYREVRA